MKEKTESNTREKKIPLVRFKQVNGGVNAKALKGRIANEKLCKREQKKDEKTTENEEEILLMRCASEESAIRDIALGRIHLNLGKAKCATRCFVLED